SIFGRSPPSQTTCDTQFQEGLRECAMTTQNRRRQAVDTIKIDKEFFLLFMTMRHVSSWQYQPTEVLALKNLQMELTFTVAKGYFPSRAVKSEYPHPYTSSPESMMGYSYMDEYQLNFSASILHLILKLLKCEPVLFSLDIKNLENFQLVESVQEQVNTALLVHTVSNYPQQTEKFRELLLRLLEIRALTMQVEEDVYPKLMNSDVTYSNLLIEMLHAKRA
ncbi:hypothetical protein STEG23_015556, partial [Scotinomys teguina]